MGYKLLNFEKPNKALSTEEHNKAHPSDCGVEGTYVPNMSDEDNQRWKCKHVKGKAERIEIRKAIGGTQLVVFVYKNSYDVPNPIEPECCKLLSKWWDTEEYKQYDKDRKEYHKNWHDDIKISMNGTLWMTNEEYSEMSEIISEAKDFLKNTMQ